ncbi:sortase [Clostridium carnis]
MKEKFRRGIGLILIIVGLTLIVSVVYRKIQTSKKQEELKQVLQEVIKDESNEPLEEKQEESVNGYKPVGLVEIPSINLSQGLVEGVTDDILQYYLGHFDTSVKPGEKGNFAIAGHRISNYSEAFVNLYKVQSGDKVIIKTKGKEFTYEIDNNFIVDPEQIEVLDNTKEATITLITCTVGAKQRVIVKGKLISTKDI